MKWCLGVIVFMGFTESALVLLLGGLMDSVGCINCLDFRIVMIAM